MLQVRGKAVWYAWRSFDPADPLQAPAASVVAPTSAALAEAELAAVARAEAQALQTGVGTAKQLVPLEEAVGGSGGHHRHRDRHAAQHRTVTVAGLEWTLYRVPLADAGGGAATEPPQADAAAGAVQKPAAATE